MAGEFPALSRIEPLAKHHDRASFSCGEPALDIYLKQQAGQDIRRRVAAVFVLAGEQPHIVAGYYSLAAHAIDSRAVPEEIGRKLPRYPDMPATLLGRLARDLKYRGMGAGEFLLLDAMRRALAHGPEIASFAMVVDAKNEQARRFYAGFGFQPLIGGARLFLPLATVEMLIGSR
jgi:ribosomal protein S18 acetylase RimI-like enzyme